jgi:hypothetical protein
VNGLQLGLRWNPSTAAVVEQIPGMPNARLLVRIDTETSARRSASESGELLAIKHLRLETAGLVKRQDTECRPHDANGLTVNKLDNDLSGAYTLSSELRQRMLLRAVSHPIKSGGVQPIDAVCLVKYQESK